MSVGLWVGQRHYEVGKSPFFMSFFSSVLVLLENGVWGSRFPVIMNELYHGELKSGHADKAMDELRFIRKEFASFPPSQAVWDFEHRQTWPPWGDNVSPSIDSLAQYFVTSDGKNLLDVLEEALLLSQARNQDLSVR